MTQDFMIDLRRSSRRAREVIRNNLAPTNRNILDSTNRNRLRAQEPLNWHYPQQNVRVRRRRSRRGEDKVLAARLSRRREPPDSFLMRQAELHVKYSERIRDPESVCMICLSEWPPGVCGPLVRDEHLEMNFEPITTDCGHLMCVECYSELRTHSIEELKCPMCRAALLD